MNKMRSLLLIVVFLGHWVLGHEAEAGSGEISIYSGFLKCDELSRSSSELKEEISRCFIELEPFAKDYFDYCQLAKWVLRYTHYNVAAAGFVGKCEEQSNSVHALTFCAEGYHEVGQSQDAERCYFKAMRLAVDEYAWLQLAESRKKVQDDVKAEDAMWRAEDIARTKSANALAWHSIGTMWKELFDNDAAVQQSVEELEKRAEDSTLAWLWAAELWHVLKQDQNMKRAVEQALYFAESSFHWQLIGEWYVKQLEVVNAVKAFEKTEELSEEYYDFVVLAQNWFDLGYIDRARNCLLRAEAVADSASDRLVIAKEWKEFKMNDLACFNLRVAKELAAEAGQRIEDDQAFAELEVDCSDDVVSRVKAH